MTRGLDILYWLLIGTVAILSVMLYFYDSNMFLDTSLLLLAIILVRQYEESVDEDKKLHLK